MKVRGRGDGRPMKKNILMPQSRHVQWSGVCNAVHTANSPAVRLSEHLDYYFYKNKIKLNIQKVAKTNMPAANTARFMGVCHCHRSRLVPPKHLSGWPDEQQGGINIKQVPAILVTLRSVHNSYLCSKTPLPRHPTPLTNPTP